MNYKKIFVLILVLSTIAINTALNARGWGGCRGGWGERRYYRSCWDGFGPSFAGSFTGTAFANSVTPRTVVVDTTEYSVTDLNRELRSANKTIANLETKIDQLENKLDAAQETIDDLKEQLRDAKRQSTDKARG